MAENETPVLPVYLSETAVRAMLNQSMEGSLLHDALTDALTFYDREREYDKDDDGPYELGDFVQVTDSLRIGIATTDTKQIANVAHAAGLAIGSEGDDGLREAAVAICNSLYRGAADPCDGCSGVSRELIEDLAAALATTDKDAR